MVNMGRPSWDPLSQAYDESVWYTIAGTVRKLEVTEEVAAPCQYTPCVLLEPALSTCAGGAASRRNTSVRMCTVKDALDALRACIFVSVSVRLCVCARLRAELRSGNDLGTSYPEEDVRYARDYIAGVCTSSRVIG